MSKYTKLLRVSVLRAWFCVQGGSELVVFCSAKGGIKLVDFGLLLGNNPSLQLQGNQSG